MKKFTRLASLIVLTLLVANTGLTQEKLATPQLAYEALGDQIQKQQASLEGRAALQNNLQERIQKLQTLQEEAKVLVTNAGARANIAQNDDKISANELQRHLDTLKVAQQTCSTLVAHLNRATQELKQLQEKIGKEERELELLKIEQAAANLLHKAQE